MVVLFWECLAGVECVVAGAGKAYHLLVRDPNRSLRCKAQFEFFFPSKRNPSEVMVMQTPLSIRSMRWLLLAMAVLLIPAGSHAQVVGISITVAPPALPVYVQPICPADNYIWTPGYWAWSDDDDDYYWVPGTWAEAPTPGFLWTPGYWGWNNGVYAWNEGYWGPHVGFYGGVVYGFGYGGTGFEGGYWRGGNFFYNRSVSNINVTVIRNVYNKTVINNYRSTTRASFNGPGGVRRQPTAQEQTYTHEHHTPATAIQAQHREVASKDRSEFASVNHGKPAVAATARPGELRGAGAVPARAAAPYKGATGKETEKAGGPAREPKGTAAAAKSSASSREKPANAESTPKKTTPRPTPSRTERTAPAEPKAETKAQPEHAAPKAAPRAQPEHEAVPKAKAAPKAEPEHEAAPKTKAAPKAEPEREAAPKAEHTAAPRSQPEHEAAPKAKAAPKAEPEREAAPKAEPKAVPKAQPEHEAAPKAEPKAEPKAPPQREAAPKAESRPEEKPKD